MASNKNNVSVPVHWGIHLFFSCLLSFIGVLMIFAGPVSILLDTPLDYNTITTLAILGSVVLIISVIVWLLFFKNLIMEAHIKAMEIFYGKKRAITPESSAGNYYDED